MTTTEPTRTNAHGAPLRPRSNAGFSLIELIIVMVILAIVMAIAIPAFTGPKETTNKKLVVATAASYKAAIEGFRLDHAGRTPIVDGPATMPATLKDWNSTELEKGPLEQLVTNTKRAPYLPAGAPEEVTTGKVKLYYRLSDVPATLDTRFAGGLLYWRSTAAPATTYAMVVLVRASGTKDLRSMCYAGNAVPTPAEIPPPLKSGALPAC